MSDKDTVTLTTTVIHAVAKALADSERAATNVTSALTSFVSSTVKHKLPKSLGDADIKALTNAYAVGQPWEIDPKTEKDKKKVHVYDQRRSEARKLFRWHARLSEGITALLAATGRCDFHNVVRLCTKLKEAEGDMPKAIALFTAKVPASKVEPIVKFEKALQAFYQTVSESKSKKKSAQMDALNKVCKALAIEAVAGTAKGESA